ncbi:hypothetical protein KY284_010886 [Solanum tuberosum]|nr:hypothetical protein KY284_010886 [Solanum tuberosum]
MQLMPQSCSILKAKSMQKSKQHVPLNFSILRAQVVQEQVQQAPTNSSTVVTQVSEKQLQHVRRESPTEEAHNIQDQVQQEKQNLEKNELSGELGPVTQKKEKRYNQPIGPSNYIVKELGSFLGTLARSVMLCPLNIHNLKNMDTKKDLWDYTQPKDVSESDFKDLLKYWDSKIIKMNPHTAGKTSFAVIRYNLAELEKLQSQ